MGALMQSIRHGPTKKVSHRGITKNNERKEHIEQA